MYVWGCCSRPLKGLSGIPYQDSHLSHQSASSLVRICWGKGLSQRWFVFFFCLVKLYQKKLICLDNVIHPYNVAGWTGETSRPWSPYPACPKTSLQALSLVTRKEFRDTPDRVVKLCKWVYSSETTLWRCESQWAEGGSLGSLRLSLLLTVVNWEVGYLLFGERISLGAAFCVFSPLFGQGLWPSLPWACLVWSDFLWPYLWNAAGTGC